VWALEFPGLRLLTSAFAMEYSMRAKTNIVTRIILAAAAAGSIATGVAVPLVATAAPAATSAAAIHPDMIGYGG
jgi:hypothetical protein